MTSIKYINIIVLLFVLIVSTLFGSRGNIETFIENDKGLPLSSIKDMSNVRQTSYFKEVDGEPIDKSLVHMIDINYNDKEDSGTMAQEPQHIANVDVIASKLTSRLNADFNKASSPKDEFKSVLNEIESIRSTKGTDNTMVTRHIVHREARMYGFVIFIKSLWGVNNQFKGIYKVEVSGIVPEDVLSKVEGINNMEQAMYRPYSDSKSFVQSEAIMKPIQYEQDIIKQHEYGLLQDRGISSKSWK